MFARSMIDLLFNLLLSFFYLFFLSFLMINEPKKEEAGIDNSNKILISLKWKQDNDIDLWLKLPNERLVFYGNRDEPPAHLDIDVVGWRQFESAFGLTTIKDNEEIISIREIVEGEYCINAHYFSTQSDKSPTKIDITIINVKTRSIIFHEVRTIYNVRDEIHIVKFIVEAKEDSFRVHGVTNNNPTYFIGQQ